MQKFFWWRIMMPQWRVIKPAVVGCRRLPVHVRTLRGPAFVHSGGMAVPGVLVPFVLGSVTDV